MKLSSRIALLLAVSVVLALVVSGMLFLDFLEDSLRQSIFASARLASTSAAEKTNIYLNDNLRDTHALAYSLPTAAIARRDTALLEQRLRTLLALYPEFENGAWILDPNGTMLVDYPPGQGVRGQSFAHRDYFRQTMANKNGVVGRPYISSRSMEPVLTFTSYLANADGRPLGLLACSAKLTSPAALGGLSHQRLGQGGYLYIFNRQRTLLIHPDHARVLTDVPALGVNKLLDAAIAGFEGVGETVNSYGVPMLASFSNIPGTDWVVAAQLPTAEAFAPVAVARARMLYSALIALVLAILVGVLALRRTSRSLRRFQETLAELLAGIRSGGPAAQSTGPPLARLDMIPGGDEIGNLAASFRTLYAELDQAVRKQRQSVADWTRTFDAVNEGIVILDKDNRFLQYNRAAARQLGIAPGSEVGRQCCGGLHRDSCHPENCPAKRVLASGRGLRGELSEGAGGDLLEIITSPMTDDNGEIVGTMHLLYDLSSHLHAEKRVEHLQHFDQLTGLPNRSHIRTLIQEQLSQPTQHQLPLAVMLIDLDHFAYVNDSLGHSAGDTLIREAAARLQRLLRPGLSAGRLGGDEFVIVAAATDRETILACSRDILEAFSQAFQIAGHSLFSTASIGIALYPDDGLDAASLLKSADIAMYHAKQHGRNSYRFFTREMTSGALERLRLGTSLRHALERSEFTLHFQPFIDLETRHIAGFEALLRWHNHEFGQIPPDRFIPMAEENGLILPIGEWVLRTACTQGSSWLAAGLPPFRIAVNLSGRQLNQDSLLATVETILHETGFPAACLELELTETVLMANPDATAAKLSQLKNLGIHIALDDFGTGYSSLNYLKNFPLDRLKIDRHFIQDMSRRADDASIVEVIISIAHTLGLHVTAEGVETNAQLDFLRDNRCDEVQGYLFNRALPAAEIPALFSQPEGVSLYVSICQPLQHDQP